MREYLLAVAAGLAIGGAWEVGGGTISAFFAAPAPAPSAPPAPFKQPTATEYWRLQGECVTLAQNILDGLGGAYGPDRWQRSATSHYRADDGRCYAIIYANKSIPRPKVTVKTTAPTIAPACSCTTAKPGACSPPPEPTSTTSKPE